MALIKCPECDKEISDKVVSCPHCGYPLVSSGQNSQRVELASVNIKLSKERKRKVFIIIGSIMVVLLIALGINGLIKERQKQQAIKEEERIERENIIKKEEYIKGVTELINSVLSNASNAEDFLSLVGQVWSNSIFKEADETTDTYTKTDGVWNEDFNDSLGKVFTEKIVDTLAMKKDFEKDSESMKKLNDFPDEYKDIHESILEMHISYESYIDFARNPNGNLESFRKNSEEKRDQFLKDLRKLKAIIPESNID